jgi:hypothetical protein
MSHEDSNQHFEHFSRPTDPPTHRPTTPNDQCISKPRGPISWLEMQSVLENQIDDHSSTSSSPLSYKSYGHDGLTDYASDS